MPREMVSESGSISSVGQRVVSRKGKGGQGRTVSVEDKVRERRRMGVGLTDTILEIFAVVDPSPSTRFLRGDPDTSRTRRRSAVFTQSVRPRLTSPIDQFDERLRLRVVDRGTGTSWRVSRCRHDLNGAESIMGAGLTKRQYHWNQPTGRMRVDCQLRTRKTAGTAPMCSPLQSCSATIQPFFSHCAQGKRTKHERVTSAPSAR